MATKVTATATYEKDTAKGKKRYSVEGKGISGSIYLEKENADEMQVTLTPKE